MAVTPSGRWKMALAVALLLGAPTWAAPSQLELTVRETHRSVANLNSSLDVSVEKLNQTSQQLLGRVNETDNQAQQLQAIIENNQQQIEGLERSLTELRSALFAHFKITDTAGMWRGAADNATNVLIEPPTTAIEPPDDDVPMPTVQPVAPAVTDTAPGPEAPAAPAAVTYGDPDVAYQKGLRTYADGDFALAYDYFQDYTKQYPQGEKIDHVVWRMAMCLLKQAKYQEAIAAFEDVRQRFPNSDRVPYAMQNQAVAHASLGQISKAEELLETVIEQFPVTPPAVKARQNLEKLRGDG